MKIIPPSTTHHDAKERERTKANEKETRIFANLHFGVLKIEHWPRSGTEGDDDVDDRNE